jgi:hypothetical protein
MKEKYKKKGYYVSILFSSNETKIRRTIERVQVKSTFDTPSKTGWDQVVAEMFE